MGFFKGFSIFWVFIGFDKFMIMIFLVFSAHKNMGLRGISYTVYVSFSGFMGFS